MPSCEKKFGEYGAKHLVRRARYALDKFNNDEKLAKRYLRELEETRASAWNKRQLMTIQQYKIDSPGLNTLDDYMNKANAMNDEVLRTTSELSLKYLDDLQKAGVSDVARNPRNQALILSIAEDEVDPKNVDDKQVVKAAKILKDHRAFIQKIAKEYGVEPDHLSQDSYLSLIHI
jgi:hypothetical protein